MVAVIFWCWTPAPRLAAHQDEPSQSPNERQPQSEQKPGQEQSPPPQTEPTPPAQAQPEPPPAQETSPPQPPPPPTEEKPTPPTVNTAPAETSQPSASKQAPATKPKAVRRRRKSVAKTQSSPQSGKVVVRNGGAVEGTAQISPAMSDDQARRQREATSQLLATTDANLKRAWGRQLTPAQQSMVDQINSYVRQSKAASDSGDLSRARTLAFKAQLLSDELARR